jgi:hypothetical protein
MACSWIGSSWFNSGFMGMCAKRSCESLLLGCLRVDQVSDSRYARLPVLGERNARKKANNAITINATVVIRSVRFNRRKGRQASRKSPPWPEYEGQSLTWSTIPLAHSFSDQVETGERREKSCRLAKLSGDARPGDFRGESFV